MHTMNNARAMIVQYWIVIPNRVKSLAKTSTYSSIPQNYITLLIIANCLEFILKGCGLPQLAASFISNQRGLSVRRQWLFNLCSARRLFAFHGGLYGEA